MKISREDIPASEKPRKRPDASTVIETSGLTKVYERVEALKNLDLEVQSNSVFGFLGPNGAGENHGYEVASGPLTPNLRLRHGLRP